MNPYEWLYTYLTPWWKRPWTYVTIDARQKYPLPWQLCLSGVMVIVGHFFWGTGLLVFGGGVTLGILMGHFWWPHKYTLISKVTNPQEYP
ncbi:hypothetical protein LCGC14_0514650 [marine sediment metagenome]|uniref:Uncharacterized protein n=1 Tax=marine sediment metagenome TaxID=412755 RepID=A0A0F9ULU7_9ZZZZ